MLVLPFPLASERNMCFFLTIMIEVRFTQFLWFYEHQVIFQLSIQKKHRPLNTFYKGVNCIKNWEGGPGHNQLWRPKSSTAASRICNGLQHLSARLDWPSDVREEEEEELSIPFFSMAQNQNSKIFKNQFSPHADQAWHETCTSLTSFWNWCVDLFNSSTFLLQEMQENPQTTWRNDKCPNIRSIYSKVVWLKKKKRLSVCGKKKISEQWEE